VLSAGAVLAASSFHDTAAGGQSRTKYDNGKAFVYARQYCGQKTNSCGKFFDGEKLSDCAHFIAHCLNAGGIRISATPEDGQLCPDNLAFRNVTLVSGLREFARNYANIREIPLSDGIVGDIGFLQLERPRHAFMVSRPGKYPDAFAVPFVWAHSTARCNEQLDTNWRHWFSTAFRLEDG
jgi:hypothetical protein